MFTLKKLHLQNFMSIDELDIDFEPKEVIAIKGKNGAGKSSLLCAVAFLLTGYRKGDSYRDYVKAGCESAYLYLEAYFKGEPLYCEAEIVGNQKKGQVQPTKRKTVYKGVTYLNSEHSQFIKEQELEYIEPLMFFFQDTTTDVIDSRPADRVAMLKRIFKFEFSDIVAKLKDEQEQFKMNRLTTTALLDEANKRTFETQPISREVIPSVVEKWEKQVDDLKNKLALLGDLKEDSLQEIERDLLSTQKNIQATLDKMERSSRDVSQLREQIQEKRSFLEENNKNELTSSLEALKEEINTHRKEFEDKKAKYEDISKNLNIEEFKQKDITGQIKLSKTGVCHACGQSITPEHVKSLEDKKALIEKNINDLKKDLADLDFDSRDTQGKELNNKVREKEHLIEGYTNEEQQISYLENRLSGLEDLEKERQVYIKELQRKKESLEEKKIKCAEEVHMLEQKEQLSSELSSIQTKLTKAKEDKIRNAEKRRYNEKVLEDKKAQEIKINDLSLKLNALGENVEDTKEALSIFENNFPSFLILQATKKLEDCINEIIQRIFPLMKVKLQMQRAGVTFTYSPEGDESHWLPVSMASGAEKSILSLAYKSSLTRLYGISCIFLDEVDAFCTEDNGEIIYKFIASLDCFPQLIFISHRPKSIEAAKEVNSDIKVFNVENGRYVEVE